jgi:hypothetical protein
VTLGATILKSPADFNECVRVSLAQSPLLTKSAIEIESKRLDVGDAYSQYIPTIILNTTFYLSLPKLRNTSGDAAMASYLANPSTDPVQNAKSIASLQQYAHQVAPNRNRKSYDLNFSTGAWNPLLTAFEVQARKELVNIAVLAHLKVIDQGLKRLASTFLQLGMVESLIKLAREKEELAAKNLEYVKTRAGLGQGAQLDVRIAEGKINMAKAECDKMRTNRTVLLDELKFIMGVPFIQKVELNLDNYEDRSSKNSIRSISPRRRCASTPSRCASRTTSAPCKKRTSPWPTSISCRPCPWALPRCRPWTRAVTVRRTIPLLSRISIQIFSSPCPWTGGPSPGMSAASTKSSPSSTSRPITSNSRS